MPLGSGKPDGCQYSTIHEDRLNSCDQPNNETADAKAKGLFCRSPRNEGKLYSTFEKVLPSLRMHLSISVPFERPAPIRPYIPHGHTSEPRRRRGRPRKSKWGSRSKRTNITEAWAVKGIEADCWNRGRKMYKIV